MLFSFFEKVRCLVLASRPKQSIKNLVIYLALFFTINEAWDINNFSETRSFLSRSTLAFITFSILTSSIYIFNDVFDLKRDRNHPEKRFRPLASSKLSVKLALVSALIMLAVSLLLSFWIDLAFGVTSCIYALTMLCYTVFLKKMILVDVFCISFGFVLRAVAGAVVLSVPISPWLYICTGLAALFLALVKRRSELLLAGDRASDQRDVLEDYTLRFLDILISVTVAVLVMAYTLYSFTSSNLPENQYMMFTVPFVVYGLFRYLLLADKKGIGENPEDIILSDRPLLICVGLWLATVLIILGSFR